MPQKNVTALTRSHELHEATNYRGMHALRGVIYPFFIFNGYGAMVEIVIRKIQKKNLN
jgi:hypothetical protein